MANSIVFQNNAEQLKSSMYGYNSSSNSYQAVQVNDSGALNVSLGTSVVQIGTIHSIGTLGRVASVGTLGTINKLTSVGTINRLAKIGTLGTISKLLSIGTLGRVASIGTLGTINKLTSVGTINRLAKIGTLGTINKLLSVGTLGRVASIGTLGTINKLANVGTLAKVVGTVKMNFVDRIFTSITQTIAVAAATITYTNLIDISKYQDTSWYLRNITTTNRMVSVQLAATPSVTLSTYPRVLISESATISVNPELITNSRYLKYITAQINNASSEPQRVVVVFNGRY